MPHELTPRQVALCELLALGMPDKQIAAELGISEDGVAHHLRILYKATGSQTRVQLVVWFFFLSPGGLARLAFSKRRRRRRPARPAQLSK
jgi:DNA-binding CsgD family transcriptional regulator